VPQPQPGPLIVRRVPLARPWSTIVVASILCAGCWVRVASLERYPAPIHQDELTDLYDGYSIATTGADRTGARWPLLVRSMGPGGYIPTLNTYLCAFVAHIAGFSVWAGRLPAAIAGMITLWLIYCFDRRLLGDIGGVLELAFAAFSPTLVLYARQAHPGVCFPPLVAVLVLVLLARWIDGATRSAEPRGSTSPHSPALIAFIGLVIGFSTMAYTGMRVTAPLLAVCAAGVVTCRLGVCSRQWRSALTGVATLTIAVTVGALPAIYTAVTMPEAFFCRAEHIVPPLSNGPTWWAGTLLGNLAANLDPHYLFLSFGTYRHLSVERLGVVSLPFLYLGLAGLIARALHHRDLVFGLIPIGVVIGLTPGIISTGNPNPMRTSVVWPLYPVAAAYGALLAWQALACGHARLRGKVPRRDAGVTRTADAVFVTVMTVVVATTGLLYAARYVRRGELHALASQPQYVAIGRWLRDHGHDYDRVYIDVDGVFGYLYVAAFSGMTPAEFQKTPREGHVTAMGWDYVHRLGRYRFASTEQALAEWRASTRSQSWLVMRGIDDVIELSPRSETTAAAH